MSPAHAATARRAASRMRIVDWGDLPAGHELALPRADEAVLRLVSSPRLARRPRRGSLRRRLPRALGPTTVSVVLHAIALVVLLAVTLAPPPADGIGAKLSVALTADLPEAFEEELIEQEPFEIEDLEPLEMPELPVVYAEEDPLPPQDEVLEELEELEPRAPRFELPVTVASQRTRPKPTPIAPPKVAPPTPRTVAVHMPPKPRPTAPRRVAMTGGRLQPIHTPLHYPESARRLGIQGVTRVEMVIGADGRILSVRLATSSGYPALDEAALASARQWRFAPPNTPRRVVQPLRFWLRT